MELKPGYKQTEVGVIPEDWEAVNIGDIAEFANGKPYESEVTPNGAHNLVTLDSIGIDGQLKNEHKRIDFLDNSLQKDDVVIILSDLAHGNLLGLCDLIPSDDAYVLNQRVGRLRAIPNTDPQYMRLQINFRQSFFKKRGQGTSQRHIYKRDIAELQIPFPRLPEQQAIAAALSDVDALISALDKLIAKKRDIKQAAMQQLLTGKKRLPGFSGEWEVKKLGEIVQINMGQSPDSKNYNHKGIGIPLIQGNADIENRKSIRRVWTTQITKVCDEGDLILTVRAPVGSIGIASEYSCLGRGVCSLKPINYDVGFLFHSLVFAESQWRTLEQGSTFTSANSAQIAEFPLLVTESIEEQIVIATILSDVDAEIAALEQKRDKTRALKQGTMQELLTGRIRLT